MCKFHFVLSGAFAAVLAIGLTARLAFSDQFDRSLWVDRLIRETETMIDDSIADHAALGNLTDTMQILGSYGRDTDAMQIEARTRVTEDDKPNELMLHELADGLCIGGFVEQAIAINAKIEIDFKRDFSLNSMVFALIQAGHIDKALSILPKIKSDELIRDTKIRIFKVYVVSGNIDAAKQLAGDPLDNTFVAAMDEAVSLQEPSIDDTSYVNSMVRIRGSSPTTDWKAAKQYLTCYYSAKYSAHHNDEASFSKYASQAAQVLNEFPDRVWERLDLAALYYENNKLDEARSLYSYVIDRFTTPDGIHPTLLLEVMSPSTGEKAPVENILHCYSETQLKDMVSKYIHQPSTRDMAAMLLALAIKENNPDWAEQIYQNHLQADFKAKVASYVLYKR